MVLEKEACFLFLECQDIATYDPKHHDQNVYGYPFRTLHTYLPPAAFMNDMAPSRVVVHTPFDTKTEYVQAASTCS